MMLLRRACHAPQRAAALRHAADDLVRHHVHPTRAAPLCSAATPSSILPKFIEVERAASLAQIYRENSASMSAEDVSSFWSALGRLSVQDPSQRQWIRHHHDVFNEAREHTRALLPRMSPAELTRSLHGAFLAGMDVRTAWYAWWADAARCIIPALRDLDSKQLSLVLHSFSRQKPPPQQLFEAVVREMETRDLSELPAFDMCQLAFRIANMNVPAQPLMCTLAAAAAPLLPSLEPKLLVTLCNAVSKVGPDAPLFYSGLAAQLPLHLPHLEPRQVAMILYACMNMAWMPVPAKMKLLDILVEDAGGRLEFFDASALAWMLQGVSQAPFDVPFSPATLALVSRLVKVSTYRMEDFEPTDLVNIARASAAMKDKHKLKSPPDFYRALSLQASKNLDGFSSFEITGLIWAYAKVGVCMVFHSLRASHKTRNLPARSRLQREGASGLQLIHACWQITPKLDSFHKDSLLTLTWACFHLRSYSPEFTDAVFEAVQRRENEFSPTERKRIEANQLKLRTTPASPRAASENEESH